MTKFEQAKTVCLITPGHLCNCPRLIKEAKALQNAGYQVYIIATSYMPFLIAQDHLIAIENPEWVIYTKYWQKGSFYGLINKYQHGFLKMLQRFFSFEALFSSILNRNFDWQLKKATSLNADLYIAHSAASIAVAARAASVNSAQFGFDAEDFHTGEDLSIDSLKWVDEVQRKYLPKANYISAASPLIADAYKNYLSIDQIETLLNVFPLNGRPLQTKSLNKPLRLFWFSQNIGKGRGLEWVFEALQGKKSEEIEFHILGNLRANERFFFNLLINQYKLPNRMITFYETMPKDKLLKLAMTFDIGLSLETGVPLNRDLCLSNKLFVYLQAGLGIIATDTSAQQEFLKDHQEGTVFLPLIDSKQLTQILSSLIKNPKKVLEMRRFNYELAQKKFNWEKEQLKFINIVNQCLREKSS
jgi:glycosyltransferase involved in cell wall biosynthesis